MSAVAGATEVLTIDRFLGELRRAARPRAGPAIAQPLEAAVKKVEANPAFTQSRLLTRTLNALTYQRGEFRRADVSGFDSETLALVIALMDAHVAGTWSRERWISAAEQALAAQAGAGG
jgi:hypothetical protein